jgi:tetratricopeptide (TPR) repeat protein
MQLGPGCPSGLILKQFALGQLPDTQHQQLAQHLEKCAQCLAAVQALPAEGTLVQAGRLERLVKWVRRRPTRAALWAAGVLALAAGAAIWLGLAHAEARRHAETARGVEEALTEARRLVLQARHAPVGELTLWVKAGAAVRRAEGLLEAGDGPEDLRAQVAQAAWDVAASERAARLDLWMIDRLEEIRLQDADSKTKALDPDQAAALYAEAFRKYGIEVLHLPPAGAAARIGARRIKDALAAGLDDWAWICRRTDPQSGRWRRLLEVADRVDPDPVHKRLRAALAKLDRQALRKLARAVPVDRATPQTLCRLGENLARLGEFAEAVHLLRQAQRRHPRDLWINFWLALSLQQEQPPQLDEAIGYFTTAVALRSQSPVVHLNLAWAYHEKGQLNEAIAEYQEAIRLKKDYAYACFYLGNALRDKGRLEEAITAYQQAIRIEPGNTPAGPGYRYWAACAAAMAGCGQGTSAARWDDGARARWRRQALDWLGAELAFWAAQLDKGGPRVSLRSALRHWQRDSTLAGLRDARGLAVLPETEQQTCRMFWAKVKTLLDRAGPPK